MADKKLNEVTKVTDMAYVPVIMADGSIGQIAKADLATVVAEQMANSTETIQLQANVSTLIHTAQGNTAGFIFIKDYGNSCIYYYISKDSQTVNVFPLVRFETSTVTLSTSGTDIYVVSTIDRPKFQVRISQMV